MAEGAELSDSLRQLVDDRIALEKKLQNESGELSGRSAADYEATYGRIQKSLLNLFRDSKEDALRIGIMLEIIRILENKLVYLQNFIVDPSAESRMMATLVDRFIEQLQLTKSTVLTPLEGTYYRAIGALYAGHTAKARELFREACESEESDEANDIKYKSFVILGHISHVESDFEKARDLHDQSLKYSQHNNVTAQAMAFKALNSYALKDFDEALELFEKSLELFDREGPYFNSYFYRNALLFCGAIHFDRKGYEAAEKFYRQALEIIEPSSYDYFDGLAQLGKIHFATSRFDEAAASFTQAIATHRFSENEYLLDTYFWLARTQIRRNHNDEARRLLEKVTTSEVTYGKRGQALELLQRVG